MNLTGFCMKNPIAAIGATVFVFMLGVYAAFATPTQLFPDIERPTLSIFTPWRAAAPPQVESEITQQVEDVLKGLPAVTDMRSFSNQGGSFVALEFEVGTDMSAIALDVISRLNRIQNLPEEADKPILQFSGDQDSNSSLVFLFLQALPGNTKDILDYRAYTEDVIIPRLESIPGVAGVQQAGGFGSDDELRITFDPYKAAELGITIPEIASAVRSTSDSSAGSVDIGRRSYSVRYEGRVDIEALRDLTLAWRDGHPIKLRDVATVEETMADRTEFSVQNGNPALGLRVMRENGANVLEVLSQVKAVVEEMNQTQLAPMNLKLVKSFDPSVFINRAIAFVVGDLALGVFLALVVLWLFLRDLRATAIFAVAIPVCLVATILVLWLAGRTINVISLAGLAFGVGHVLDACIVVVENILRLRSAGVREPEASTRGASEVWKALFASSLTSVVIFVPIIFVADIEGQLFADLALTISISVCVSLITAVTVVPLAVSYFLPIDRHSVAGSDAMRSAQIITRLTDTPTRRYALIVGLISFSAIGTWALLPDLHYLPSVRRDAIDSFVGLPQGTSIDVAHDEIAQPIIDRLQPYMTGEKQPQLLNYYVFTNNGGLNVGVRVQDESRLQEMGEIIKDEILVGFPDTQVFSQQGFLFGGFGGGGGLQLTLQAPDPEKLVPAIQRAMELIPQKLPGAFGNPSPDLSVRQPEIVGAPNDQRLLETGMSRRDAAQMLQAFVSGLYAGEFFDGEKRVDVLVRAEKWADLPALKGLPVATRTGGAVTFGDLVNLREGTGTPAIFRYDGRRAVQLFINTPDGMALEDALTVLRNEIVPAIEPLLPPGGNVMFSGSADSLDKATGTMLGNFALALGLLLVLMALLFRSLKDSFFCVIALPLATVGGMAALQIVNIFAFTPLDLLAMIGFIILTGLVVNNAILLVDQTRASQREGVPVREAVAQAIRYRTRPILSGTLTNLVGMLPLMLSPGEGAEIYRGLATAIAGGMAVSTLFTLILLPALLRFGEHGELKRLVPTFRRAAPPAALPAE
ncbi:MAG: efflux RND transporter permease subunit [Micropepsaceae bacterium]